MGQSYAALGFGWTWCCLHPGKMLHLEHVGVPINCAIGTENNDIDVDPC